MSYAPKEALLGIAAIFLVIAVVLCIARFIVRRGDQGAWYRWDDWLCLPPLFFFAATLILVIFGAVIKLSDFAILGDSGISNDDLDFNWTPIQALEWLFECSWLGILALSKLSILFFYRRVVNKTWWSTGLIAFTIIWGAAFGLGVLAVNGDANKEHFAILGAFQAKLHGSTAVYIAMSIIDALETILLIVIFAHALWCANAASKLKVAGGIILLIGVISAICGIVRLIIFLEVSSFMSASNGSLPLVGSTGTPALARALIFWGTLEMGFAYIAVSLPVFKAIGGEDYDIVQNNRMHSKV